MRKLQTDLDTKLAQRDEMKEQRRLQKEGISTQDAGSDAGDEEDDEEEDEEDEEEEDSDWE